jgi:hypothetical protein
MLSGIALPRRPTEGLLRRRNASSKEPPILVQYRTGVLLSKRVGTILGRVFKTPRRLILSPACSGSFSSRETVLPGPKGLASQVVARASTIVRRRPVSESAGGLDGGTARPVRLCGRARPRPEDSSSATSTLCAPCVSGV